VVVGPAYEGTLEEETMGDTHASGSAVGVQMGGEETTCLVRLDRGLLVVWDRAEE
jgi:hypothetical protein